MKRDRKAAHQQPVAEGERKALSGNGFSPTVLFVALLLAAAVLVFAVHWPALSAGALSFDDHAYLVDNPLVRNPGLTSAWRFMTEVLKPSTIGGYYQPLSMISLMIDYALGGRIDDLFPFHRTSLILHVANTLLIITSLYLLFHQPWPATVVGLLFGLHPLTIEPIPWVGERKTVLAAFFALLSLIAYIRYAQTGRIRLFVVAILAYVLALLSKPTSTPLPLAMLLLDYWPLNRISRRAVLEKLPLLTIGAASAVITFVSQRQTAGVTLPGEYDPLDMPLTLCHNIMFYPYKMLWPADLSSHYAPPSPLRLSDPWIAAGVVGSCLLIPFLVWSLRRTRAFATGWLIYFLMLGPTIQIIGFSNVIASDKYAYLPSVGLLIILCHLIVRWLGRAPSPDHQLKRVGIMAAIALLLFSAEAYATRKYLTVWRDTEGLYRHMIRLAPKAPSLHAHLGNLLLDQGRVDEAVQEARRAVQYGPKMPATHNDLANALRMQGKTDEAIAEYNEALRVQPDDATALSNLGTLLVDQGRGEEALDYFKEAIRRFPTLADAHYNLARTLVKLGRNDEAMASYKKTLELRYHYSDAHNDLGTLLAGQGRIQEAIDHFREAIRFSPNYAEAHFNLAETLERLGRLPEAVREYQEVVRIDPHDEGARHALETLTQQKR